jgi:hypothetical protein
MSDKGRPEYLMASLRDSGTVIPRKKSPSPYWPLPVLKKPAKSFAFFGLAFCFKSLNKFSIMKI